MIAPQLERYFQLRLEWKLEVEPEVKARLRRELDAATENICREHSLSFGPREFLEHTRQAFIQWAKRSR